MCIKDNYNEICYKSTNLQKIYNFMGDCENNCIKFGSCDYNGWLNDKCVELEAIRDGHTTTKQYYQIDYIDKQGLANYINTLHDLDEAIKHFTILSNALKCITLETYFVLDLYEYQEDKEGEPIEDTDRLVKTIKEGKIICN